MVPSAKPSGSRGQPASPPRGSSKAAAAPSQAPSARRRESRAELTGRQTGAPPEGGGDLSGAEKARRAPALAPLPSPSRGSPSRRMLLQLAATASGRAAAEGAEGSRLRLGTASGPPRSQRVVSPSACRGGGAGRVSRPYLSAAVGGTSTDRMGKVGHGCAPERGPHRRLCLRGTVSSESNIPVPRTHACRGEPAIPGWTACLKLPPRTGQFLAIKSADEMEKSAVWIGKSTALGKGDPPKCV